MYPYILADGRLMAGTHPREHLPRHAPHYFGARETPEGEWLAQPDLETRKRIRREAMSDKIAIYALMGDHSKDDLLNDVAAQYATYKKNVTGDDRLVKASVDTIKHYLTLNVEREYVARLTEAYDEYTMFNGERPSVPGGDPTEWDSGLDDVVEKLTEPYISVLSADWLGKNTVDCRLHEEGEIVKFAKAIAAEVYKQATAGRTDVQIMSGGGLTMDLVRAAIGGETPQGSQGNGLAGVVGTLKAVIGHAGEAFDPLAMYEELDLASDTDDNLALGAIQRLIPEADDSAHRYYVLQMQNFRISQPAEAVDKLLEMMTNLALDITAYDEWNIPPGARAGMGAAQMGIVEDVPLPGDRPKRSRGKKSEPQPAVEGAMDHRILALLKDHANVADKELAEKIGVSRATMNNHVNGKTPFIPSPEQRGYIRNTVWEHLAGLLEAFSLIDGVDYTVTAEPSAE